MTERDGQSAPSADGTGAMPAGQSANGLDTAPAGQSADETGATPVESSEQADSLGDAGKRALEKERAARREAEKLIKEYEQELSRLRRANAAIRGTDLEQIRQEIAAEFAAQILAAEIKAEAKGRLADPSDASRYPEYFEGVKAGDSKSISAALDRLLSDKPHLAAERPAKGWGDVGGGQREDADSPASPLDRMRRAYRSSK